MNDAIISEKNIAFKIKNFPTKKTLDTETLKEHNSKYFKKKQFQSCTNFFLESQYKGNISQLML